MELGKFSRAIFMTPNSLVTKYCHTLRWFSPTTCWSAGQGFCHSLASQSVTVALFRLPQELTSTNVFYCDSASLLVTSHYLSFRIPWYPIFALRITSFNSSVKFSFFLFCFLWISSSLSSIPKMQFSASFNITVSDLNYKNGLLVGLSGVL